jgi:hypothetical protein
MSFFIDDALLFTTKSFFKAQDSNNHSQALSKIYMVCVCVCVCVHHLYERHGSLRTLSNKSFKLNFNLIILSVGQVPLTNAYMDIYQPDQTTG